jgi:putative oxidoreductase
MKHMYEGLDGSGLRPPTAAYGALVLRVALGLVFLAHGLFKVLVLSLPGTAAFFVMHGFPGWTAYPVTGIELLGGVLLVAGIATRTVSVALLSVVLGAFRVHWQNGWYFGSPNGGWEFLAVLVAGLVGLVLIGPGALRVAPHGAGAAVAEAGSASRGS